jgi:hypothetical protein
MRTELLGGSGPLSLVVILLKIPLLMSLRAGAWIVIAVQVPVLLIVLVLVFRGTQMFGPPVVGPAMTCYCIARLRGSLGPPMITIRRRRIRAADAI